MGRKKGQTSFEIVIYVSVLLIILIIAVTVVGNKSEAAYRERVSLDAQHTVELLATEINIAINVGDGYSHEFSISPVLYNGEEYDMDIDAPQQYVNVIWKGNYYSMPILTPNVTGNFSFGDNKIKNVKGVVEIASP